jgi:hypothetical protein
MAGMNSSYGSELHLLRMLGRHRAYFDARVRTVIGFDAVEWLDFPSGVVRKKKEAFCGIGNGSTLIFLIMTTPLKRHGMRRGPRIGPDKIGMRLAGLPEMGSTNGCWSKPRQIFKNWNRIAEP